MRYIFHASTIALAMLTIGSGCCVGQPTERKFTVADYGDMRFRGGAKSFRAFFSGSLTQESPIAKIYIQIDDDVFYLPELPEDVIEKLDPIENGNRFGGSVRYAPHGDSTSSFYFKGGKVFCVMLSYNSTPFKIGPTKDGPFEPTPISHERMIELFGEPTKWDTAPVAAP